MTSTDPSSVRVDLDTNRVVITWRDGHESRYTGAYLRWTCPCAACRGHAPGQVEPPRFEDVRQVRLLGAGPVGSYALRFDFSDGHDSGIFTWQYLYRLGAEQEALWARYEQRLAEAGLDRDAPLQAKAGSACGSH